LALRGNVRSAAGLKDVVAKERYLQLTGFSSYMSSHCFTVRVSSLFPRAPLGPGGAQGYLGPHTLSSLGEPPGPSPLTGIPPIDMMV